MWIIEEKQNKTKKTQNFPKNPKFPRKSEISHPNTILMMMMTIWWSKATRLLEFSRSLDIAHSSQKNVTPFAWRTDRQAGGGIGYSSSWIALKYNKLDWIIKCTSDNMLRYTHPWSGWLVERNPWLNDDCVMLQELWWLKHCRKLTDKYLRIATIAPVEMGDRPKSLQLMKTRQR